MGAGTIQRLLVWLQRPFNSSNGVVFYFLLYTVYMEAHYNKKETQKMQVIPLRRSFLCAIVDDVDYALVVGLPWREHKCPRTSYAIRSWREDGKILSAYMHRQLLNAPKGMEVDHTDHNGLNNCRDNIRIVSPEFNRHRARPYTKSVSGLKGVWFCKPAKLWSAEIHVGKNKKYNLGLYASKYWAAYAFNTAAVAIQGPGSYQNAIPIGEMPGVQAMQKIRNDVHRVLMTGSMGRTGRRPDNYYSAADGVAAGTLL